MSGTRRTRISRQQHAPFTDEVVRLFIELEGAPERARPYSDDTRRLAKMLGLTSEWWTGQHVNDKSDKPIHPKGYCAHDDFYRCRAVRQALLEAAERQQAAE